MVIPDEAGMGHAPQSFAKAASERIRSGLSPKTINSSAAVLAPTPKLARRVGDVSVVRRARWRSCVAISSARANQRRASARRVCFADAERKTELVQADFRAPRENQEHSIHEGRYNHEGQPHWYLADSVDTGISEILDDEAGVVFTQQFELAPCENVLDLWIPHDEAPVTSLDGSLLALALVLSHANLYKRVERRRAWKPGYLLPRFIMDAAKHAGFAGIRYSSVRAFEGVNLVLFNSDTSADYAGEIERHTYNPHKAVTLLDLKMFPT